MKGYFYSDVTDFRPNSEHGTDTFTAQVRGHRDGGMDHVLSISAGSDESIVLVLFDEHLQHLYDMIGFHLQDREIMAQERRACSE